MSTVSGLSSTTSADSTTSTKSTTAALSSAMSDLDADDFLTLLLTELEYQDAMNPVSDKDFIAQMAQFSALAETSELNDSFASFARQNSHNEALYLLGTRITAVDSDTAAEITGTVTAVTYQGSDPLLTLQVDETKTSTCSLSEVTKVSY